MATDVARWLARAGADRGRAILHAYQHTFSGDAGRQVLEDLAEICHDRATAFVPGDSGLSAFREGQHSVLLHVRDVLGQGAELFLKPSEGKDG